MCLGKCIYSIEGRESYKPWISHLCITVQSWPTFDENLPLCSMENKVSSLMWPRRFRIQKLVSASGWDCCRQHPPPPALPIMHFGHGSEHRQCQNAGFEASSWACEWHSLCVYIRSHLTSECDFNLAAIFVQNRKESVSPITFEFEETSYATFTFPDGARHGRKTSEGQLVRPRCNEKLADDIEMRTSWHPRVPGSLPVAEEA